MQQPQGPAAGTHSHPGAGAAAGKRGVCVGSTSPAALSWPHPTAAGKGPSTGPQQNQCLQAQHCSATAEEFLSQREENQQLKIAVYRNNNPRGLGIKGRLSPQYEIKSFACRWEWLRHTRACEHGKLVTAQAALLEWGRGTALSYSGVTSAPCIPHSPGRLGVAQVPAQALQATFGKCQDTASSHCHCRAATAGLKRGGCTVLRKFHWCVRDGKETYLLIGIGMDSLVIIRLIPPVPRLQHDGANWGHC